MPGRFAVHGVVVDGSDQPLAMITVRLDGRLEFGSTDGEGRFVLHPSKAGDQTIRADARFGEIGSTTCAISDAGESPFVRIHAKRSGEIEGRVLDEDDHPLAGIEMNIVQEHMTWGQAVSATDADGHFAAEGFAPGDYRLDLLCACEPEDSEVTFHVDEGQKTIITIHTNYGTAMIRGRVVDASGAAVAHVHVGAMVEPIELHSLRFWKRDQPQVTKEDGTFVFRRLSKSAHTVFAWRDSGPEVFAKGVEDGATIELRLPSGGSLAGTVSSPQGGSPASFYVDAETSDGWVRRESFAHTGGRWILDDLPQGDYRLTYDSAEGFATKVLSLDEGEAKSDVHVELEDLVTIRGRVLDRARGTPLADVPIRLALAGERSSRTWPETETDSQGAFHFDQVPATKASLTIDDAWWYSHQCLGNQDAPNTTSITVTSVLDQELDPIRIRCGGELRGGSR